MIIFKTINVLVVLFVSVFLVMVSCELKFSVPNEAKTVSCVKEVIYTYYDGRPLILLQEELGDSVGEDLIKSGLNASWVITTAQQKDYKFRRHSVFILQPSAGEQTNYSTILSRAYKSSYFILLWPPGTETSSLEELHQQFWNYHLLRVVSLVPLGDGDTNIYTYFPYGRFHCHAANYPLIVDSCRNNSLSRKFKLFSATARLQNFYGCNVTCFGNNQVPEITTRQKMDGSWEISGNVVLLLDALSKHYNFTPQFVGVFEDTHGWFFYNDTVQSKALNAENLKVEFGFGTYSQLTFLSDRNVDHSFAAAPECFTWGVPPLAGKQPSIWANYVNEFSFTVWLLLVAFFVGTSIIVVLMANYSRNEKRQLGIHAAAFVLFTSMVMQSTTLRPRSKPLKMLLLQWTWWMMVIHASYEASLGSFMTVQWPVQHIKSAREIMENGLRVTGGVQMYELLKTASTGNAVLRTLYDRFEVLPPTSLDNIVNSIYENRDMVVLFPKRFVLYSSRYRARLDNKTDRVHLVEECVWKTYASPFVTRKDAFMAEPINEFTHKIFEAGLLKHWRTKDGYLKEWPKIEAKTFSREHLRGAYTILFIGCLIAFLCLVTEHLYDKYINHKYSKPFTRQYGYKWITKTEV